MFRFFFLLLCLLELSPVPAEPVLSINEVAPGLFVHFGPHAAPDKHNQGAIANIGFIVGDRCIAVIDTGGNPNQGKALKNAIEHVSEKPICYVINTHIHPDHIYGNAVFKGKGVEFVGHHRLAEAMASRGSFYLDKARDLLGIELSAADIVPPNIAVNRNLELDLGGRILKLTAYPPAHTDSDLSVYDQKTDTMWLADLLFIEHLPVIDGSLKGWLSVLSELEGQSFRRVIPGHGPLVTDWPKSMQPEKDYLSMVQTEIRALIKNGGFLEQALTTTGYSAKPKWRLFDEFHRKNISTAFAELEWED